MKLFKNVQSTYLIIERMVTGTEKHAFRILVARSVTLSEIFAGEGVPGLCIRQIMFATSDKSISAVAMVSSIGCSREIVI